MSKREKDFVLCKSNSIKIGHPVELITPNRERLITSDVVSASVDPEGNIFRIETLNTVYNLQKRLYGIINKSVRYAIRACLIFYLFKKDNAYFSYI